MITYCILATIFILIKNCDATKSQPPSANSKFLMTSDSPIVFKKLRKTTYRKEQNGTLSEIILSDPPRSRPLLFEKALGLRRNQKFEFHVDSWKSLMKSGLFNNLAAKITTDDEDKAVIEISGDEKPSITFSPELSAGNLLETYSVIIYFNLFFF